jgi:putative CRISPR-associated protein (TIGR02619 family)
MEGKEYMHRLVISTVGTSLLTNQIDTEFEPDWTKDLQNTAHLTEDEIKFYPDPEVARTISTLKSRAETKLSEGNILEIRETSAELNGIYGLYGDKIEQGKEDIHWLIATDTAQGQTTAKIVEKFIKSKELVNTSIYTPPGLSTANTKKFSEGIDDLLVWLRKQIKSLKGYTVYFNLVGSFKSLQGYMNTIGMFYANEIIYIFEGKQSELITIPRLPIKVDESLLQPHAAKLARMDAGAGLSSSDVVSIPEALIGDCDGKKVLSTWGQLIWNECKEKLLSQELLEFPRLQYADTFRADYNKINNEKEKAELQQDLAKVSNFLNESNGDTKILGKPFDYYPYQGLDKVDHFRVNRSLRISCKVVAGGNLSLRFYGTHNHVERSEKRLK